MFEKVDCTFNDDNTTQITVELDPDNPSVFSMVCILSQTMQESFMAQILVIMYTLM